MKRRNLEKCRALLTGASSGIGREIALALARRGAQLLLLARNEVQLCALVQQCNKLGGQSQPLVGDVADPRIREAALAQVNDHWQGLDLLINNAGVSAHGLFAGGDESTLRRIMEVNFFAPVELTRGALPLLQRGRRPAVVNVASILGHRGIPYNSEYSASKFALRGWSESIRAEFAKLGVDVLVVSPGSTNTEFYDHLLEKRGTIPWGPTKGISPEVVARQTLSALEAGRHEIFPNWRGRLLVGTNRLVPRLVDAIMQRYG